MSVFIPPRDAFSGTPQRTSRLICQATDFSPKQISLSWFREGKRVVSGISEGPVETVQSSPMTFRTYSMLTITESEWLSQSVFTCEVEHSGMTFQKNVSSVCGPCECSPRGGGGGPSHTGLQTPPPTSQQLPEPWLLRAAKGREGLCAGQLGAHEGLGQLGTCSMG